MNLDELLKVNSVRCARTKVDEDLVEGEVYKVEEFIDVVYHPTAECSYDILKVDDKFKVRIDCPRTTEISELFDDISQAKVFIEKDIANDIN